MKMRLATVPRIFDPLLQDIFCLLDKLAMKVNRVIWDPPIGIVLPEDKIRGLLIELRHFCAVCLSLFRQVMSCCSISAFVGLTGLIPALDGLKKNRKEIEYSVKACSPFRAFGACKIAQPVVLCFRIVA